MAIARNLPAAVGADGTASLTPSRAGIYGEAYVNPISGKELFAADEASYFMALNSTPGTGIIGTASIAAITDVSPTMVVYNGGAKRCYPQFLNLHETVVSTSGARVQFTFYLDNINRRASAGTLLPTTCTNSGSTDTSGVVVYAGAIVSPAASAKVLIDHVVFRGTIDVVEDQYDFTFGGQGGGLGTGPQATTVQHFTINMPPVCILPGHSMVMHQWAGSQVNAPTYLYRFGFIAR